MNIITGWIKTSLLLEDVEEVLHLQRPVLGKVRAVDPVLGLTSPKDGSQGFWPHRLRHLWVMGAAQLPEGRHHVLLPDFKSNAGAIRELLDQLVILGHNSLIDLQEFLY